MDKIRRKYVFSKMALWMDDTEVQSRFDQSCRQTSTVLFTHDAFPLLVFRSTDSQLKLWNVNKPHCLRSFKGHINEKNFVGLASNGDYVACGKESVQRSLYTVLGMGLLEQTMLQLLPNILCFFHYSQHFTLKLQAITFDISCVYYYYV